MRASRACSSAGCGRGVCQALGRLTRVGKGGARAQFSIRRWKASKPSVLPTEHVSRSQQNNCQLDASFSTAALPVQDLVDELIIP